MSLAPLVCTLPLSSAPLLCIGHLYLSCASHLHLSISPLTCSLPLHLTSSRLRLSFASLIAPLTCTSDAHLLQHLSIASLRIMCATQLHISVAHLSCISQSHLSFGPLSFSSYSHLNAAHHICTSSAHLHPSDAPLFHLIFKAKCYQAGSLVPLAWLPQLSLKVGLKRGVAPARSAAVSPTLDTCFVVAMLFACSNFVVAPSVCECKVSHAS